MAKLKGGKAGSIKTLKSKLKKGSGGDQFLSRVPADGSIIVRFLEEPDEWVEYLEHFVRDRAGSWSFPCIENCQESHEGDDKPKRRFLANAVDTQENKVIPMQLPVSAVSSLVKKYDKYGTILDRDYEISKSGTGFDTEYDVDAEPPTKMNLSRFDLLDLEAILLSQAEGSDDDEDDDDDDDEDEKSVSKSRPSKGKGPKRSTRPAPPRDVADDDDDDDEDDDEDEGEPAPRKTVRKSSTSTSKTAPAKKPIRKIIKKK